MVKIHFILLVFDNLAHYNLERNKKKKTNKPADWEAINLINIISVASGSNWACSNS